MSGMLSLTCTSSRIKLLNEGPLSVEIADPNTRSLVSLKYEFKLILYSTNLFKRNDIIVYCNFLKTDRIFSWNTSKFSSCPVDAENGFKLNNLMNMKEDM